MPRSAGSRADVIDIPTVSDSAYPVVERRKSEQRNFLALLESPSTIEECQDPEFFQTMIALAVLDYGVSRKKLVGALRVSEGTLSKWISGVNAPYALARPEILKLAARILREQLEAPSPVVPQREHERETAAPGQVGRRG